MEHRGPIGADAEDHDFTVSQDAEFDEADEPRDGDDRALDDVVSDDVLGIDDERRVVLPDDRVPADDDA